MLGTLTASARGGLFFRVGKVNLFAFCWCQEISLEVGFALGMEKRIINKVLECVMCGLSPFHNLEVLFI